MLERILVVDDDALVLDLVAATLEAEGFHVSKVRRGAAGLQLLRSEPHELVLWELPAAGPDGMELLDQVTRQHPGTDVVIMACHATREGALDALAHGASGYLVKPLSRKDIVQTIRRILERRRLHAELRTVRSELRSRFDHHHIVAASPRTKALLAALGRLADSDAPVLLCGETGTGRRFFARTLHQTGPRREHPCEQIACDTTPSAAVRRALLGEKLPGQRLRRGMLERLEQGTLHLFEVEQLEHGLQSWLAGLLASRRYHRVGESTSLPLATRVILSITGSPDVLLASGKLVPELAHSRECVTVHVPSLASRADDLPGLVQVFLDMFAVEHGRTLRVRPATVELLARQSFLGNVRQLFATLTHCAKRCPEGVLTPELVERSLRQADVAPDGKPMSAHLRDHEYEILMGAVQKFPRRLDEAARHLGISRTTLWRRMRKYGIQSLA